MSNYKYKITLYENYNNYDDIKLSLKISEEQARILEKNIKKLKFNNITHEPVTDYVCDLLEGLYETITIIVNDFKEEEAKYYDTK